jgi:hypothetical protein
MPTVYRERHVTARIIWDFLKANGDSSSYKIQTGTGLTHMQFWYGLGFLRDVMQTQNGQPLIYSPYRGVYSLTTNEGDWMDYLMNWRLKSILTQLRRSPGVSCSGRGRRRSRSRSPGSRRPGRWSRRWSRRSGGWRGGRADEPCHPAASEDTEMR